MLNINFVPDDYVQNSESRRTNLMYLVLFAVVMVALGGSFMTIKIRQRACATRESLANKRMAQMQQAIKQFEELQTKRKAMMKTALTTAELLEPVPRSIVLASLTNNLPTGVSLLKLSLIQKEPKQPRHPVATSKYKAAQAQNSEADQTNLAPEKRLETHIEIGGMAPSDIQLSAYIEKLKNSSLLDNVALVESKEYTIDDTTYREFNLTAMLKKQVHLTSEDVNNIRVAGEQSVYNF